jgi:signal transduction histidine kinase
MEPAEESRTLREVHARLADLPDPAALLERLFAFAPVAFQIYRADGRVVLTNAAFRDLFGAVPPSDYNVFQDEVVAARGILDPIRRAFAGATVRVPPIWYDARELRHVRVASGRRVAIAGTFFPLRDRDGRVAFVAIVFQDTTRELERRAQADAEASRLGLLARASTILPSSLDYETTLAAVARAAVPEFADACAVDLAVDGQVRRLAGPADAVVEALAAPALREGRSVLLTQPPLVAVPLVAGGCILGRFTFVRGAARRPFDAGDLVAAEELAARAGLSIEIARLYAESRRTSDVLREASRAKDEFLAMLGHELRNPLSPIVTALELMRLRGGDAFAAERAVIQRQVEHLTHLVDDLLDVSRIAGGKIELRKKVVEIGATVARAIETTSPLLEQRAHRLTVAVPVTGLTVEGDETRLAQVVTNLLANAAKYTEREGAIAVSAARAGAAVELRVRDTGAGIPADLLPHVFDLFVQGRRGIDRSQGGLGLGLAIVRSIVDLHGGSVEAASAGVGQGSEFVVRLPFAAPTAPAAPGTPAAPPARSRP